MSQTTMQIIKRAAIVSSAALALILTSGGMAIAAETQPFTMVTPATLEKSAFPGIPNPIDPIGDKVKDGVNVVRDGVNGVRHHWKDITRCVRGGANGARVGGLVGGTVGPGGARVGLVGGAGAGCALALR